MENLQKYLSTAPLFMLLLTFTAGFIIEINRFFLIWDCISRLLFSELIL
jgi:hypothetical protein